MRAPDRTVQSPLPSGERVRVRGTCGSGGSSVHLTSTATLSPGTGERAKGARRRPLCNPGSRPGKSPLRGAFGLFPPAFGSGTSLHPCRLCPLGVSLRLAPACGQRLSDFQPDQGIAVVLPVSDIAAWLCHPARPNGTTSGVPATGSSIIMQRIP